MLTQLKRDENWNLSIGFMNSRACQGVQVMAGMGRWLVVLGTAAIINAAEPAPQCTLVDPPRYTTVYSPPRLNVSRKFELCGRVMTLLRGLREGTCAVAPPPSR